MCAVLYWSVCCFVTAACSTEGTEHHALHSRTDNKSWTDWGQISHWKYWTKPGFDILHFHLCVQFGLSWVIKIMNSLSVSLCHVGWIPVFNVKFSNACLSNCRQFNNNDRYISMKAKRQWEYRSCHYIWDERDVGIQHAIY